MHSRSMMIIQSLIIALSLTVQATMAIETDGNFFSSPSSSEMKLPRYRKDAKPAEKIRAHIQANTPELEQVRLISSLKGKQREEIVKAYERGRAELQPMNAEFNQLRKGMSLSMIEKMLSKEEPQMDAMTKSEDFELLLKSRSMLQKLRSKRLSLWEEIQAKLSPTQLDELDKLKSGQVPVEYLNSQEATNEIKVDPKK